MSGLSPKQLRKAVDDSWAENVALRHENERLTAEVGALMLFVQEPAADVKFHYRRLTRRSRKPWAFEERAALAEITRLRRTVHSLHRQMEESVLTDAA